jgi:PIN domain nuclease of toxin-antitoxin system
MIPSPVLDTHVWVWWMLGDPRLKPSEREALDSLPPDRRPVLCDISLWELGTLVDLGRVVLEDEIGDWLRVAASPVTVRLQPVTPEIVAEMNRLPASFHRDPADRLIVATARALALPLATKDGLIRRSRLVSLWKGSVKNS